jgi:DNA-binding MarR family transcriptional regulator
MQSETAELQLEHFLPYRLSVLTNRVSAAIARHYSERFNLSVPEWRVMAVLGGASNLSASEVAARTAMDKVQVSRAVVGLTAARRVQRQFDAKDRRITRLSLTAKGRAIYEEIVPLALHLEAVLLSALSAEEKSQLDRLLEKLSRRIGNLISIGM